MIKESGGSTQAGEQSGGMRATLRANGCEKRPLWVGFQQVFELFQAGVAIRAEIKFTPPGLDLFE